MSEQPREVPQRRPSAFDLESPMDDPSFSCRHWIYDIYDRSRQLYDIDDTKTTVDGSLISYEVGTTERQNGDYNSLRVREAIYALAESHGDAPFTYQPSLDPSERTIQTYVVESIVRNHDDQDLDDTNWIPFVAVIIDHDAESGLDIFICDPETGVEFDEFEIRDMQYLLQGMSTRLMEEMASQVILTDPDREKFMNSPATTSFNNDFYAHEWIEKTACFNCSQAGRFCVHMEGNLN